MKRPGFLLLLALIVTTQLSAQVVYNSRTTYNLAHPSSYIIDFNNDGPAGTFYPGGLAESTPFGNVTFNGIPSSSAVEALNATSFGISGSGNFLIWAPGGQFLADSILITLPANTFSFGTDIVSPSQTVPEPYQFTVFAGSTILDTVISPSVYGSYTFFGFDSLTSPITSVTVQIANAIGAPEPVLDNFTVVPEPATWLAGLALTVVLLFKVRPILRGRGITNSSIRSHRTRR